MQSPVATGLLLFENGVLQKEDEDYTLSGNTITFLPDEIPQSGALLLATYPYGS